MSQVRSISFRKNAWSVKFRYLHILTIAVALSDVLRIIFLISLYLENKQLPNVGTYIPVYSEEMP